jgi:hypothetical protein
MRQQQQHQPTTIAVLGADTLVEDILARLLREEGYDASARTPVSWPGTSAPPPLRLSQPRPR